MSNVLDLKHPEEELPPQSGMPFASLLSGPEAISWTAEHTLTPRARVREYMVLAGVGTVGTLVSWWQSSWLTFAVIALGIAAWELRSRFPSSHRIDISGDGISIDGYRHRYAHLRSFDLHTMPDGSARLSLCTTRWHLPDLHIPLGERSPQEVHAVLSRYLSHDEHPVPVLDYFLKK